MSRPAVPRDSVLPSSPPDEHAKRSHKHISAVFRKIGNAIRKKSPEPSHMDMDLDPDVHTQPQQLDENSSMVDAHCSTNIASPFSFDAGSGHSTSPSSIHQPSIRSATLSFESRTSRATGSSVISHVSRQSTRDERARRYHSRYGLTMDPRFTSDRNLPTRAWGDDSLARVQKSARLRMHATCHLCHTAFRASSHCPQCKHHRCRLCPRALPKGVQALIDQTRKQLDSIPEPPRDDFSLLQLACTRHRQDEQSSLAIDQAAVARPAAPDLTFGRSMSNMVQHSAPHTLYTRNLCLTIEQASASICERQSIGLKKFYQLFPLSFRILTRWALKTRQERVFKLPTIKIRHFCQTCHRCLPQQHSPCIVCKGPPIGDNAPGFGMLTTVK